MLVLVDAPRKLFLKFGLNLENNNSTMLELSSRARAVKACACDKTFAWLVPGLEKLGILGIQDTRHFAFS